jgi:hypothetical protein
VDISRKSMFMSFALLLSILLPVQVHAECIQTDLKGVWYAYGISMGEIDRCKIKVNSSGSIVGSKSKCSARDATGRFSLNIGGGNMYVSDTCVVTGKITFCEGACVSSKIEHGMLERDKNVVTAEGYLIPDPAAVFSFVGIKK